jgi:hypothetical protein
MVFSKYSTPDGKVSHRLGDSWELGRKVDKLKVRKKFGKPEVRQES